MIVNTSDARFTETWIDTLTSAELHALVLQTVPWLNSSNYTGKTMMYKWQRYDGYEVSTKGDARFSAFRAKLPDGRSIEEHYQCDVKGHDPGGTNWKLGKSKPPNDRTIDLWAAYLNLWRQWADAHPELMDELESKVLECGGILSDRFASTNVNPARALATILNERLEDQVPF